MQLSIIIPVFNCYDLTKSCLLSLKESCFNSDIEIIVVDNGSNDETINELDSFGLDIFKNNFNCIHLDKNLGFAKACNLGAKKAQGEILFFLNNDTICTPNFLSPLLNSIEKNNIGAVGPLLCYPNNTIQHIGIAFSPFLKVSHIYEHFPKNHEVVSKKRPLQAITAAALLIRKSIFFECNLFCEEYLNGYEDMDLCFSLKNKGYKVDVISDSCIIHYTSSTSGRFDHESNNAKLLQSRWSNIIKPDLHILAYLDGFNVFIDKDLKCLVVGKDEVIKDEIDINEDDIKIKSAIVKKVRREAINKNDKKLEILMDDWLNRYRLR